MAEKEKKSQDTTKSDKPLDKMTVVELRGIAKEIPGITGVHAMKKAELLAAIKEHQEMGQEEPEKKKKKVKAKKVALTSSQLKEKAGKLRQEKETAQGRRERNKVKILQRRINRLKKMSRKVASG